MLNFFSATFSALIYYIVYFTISDGNLIYNDRDEFDKSKVICDPYI